MPKLHHQLLFKRKSSLNPKLKFSRFFKSKPKAHEVVPWGLEVDKMAGKGKSLAERMNRVSRYPVSSGFCWFSG